MMKQSTRFIFIAFMSLLVFTSCQGEEKKFDKKVMPLWSITKEGIDTSYYLGTTEYLPKEEAQVMFTEKIIAAFDSAELYLTQIDIQRSDFIKVKPALEIEGGKTLSHILSSEDLGYLKNLKNTWNKSEPNSVPKPDSTRLKLLFYVQDMLVHGNQNSFYFDQFWSERAMPLNKKMDGMETYQDYYGSFSVVNLEEQIEFMKSMDSVMSFKTELRNSVKEFYLNKDYEGLYEYYLTTFPYLNTHKSTFISDKHKKWANKISQAIDTTSCYITLDVIHFQGENNLKEILLSKGYTVTRIQ